MSFADLQSLVSLVLRLALGVHVDEGVGTRFGDPGDAYMGGKLACLNREMRNDDMVCAHLWLPCGTKIIVTNLERPGTAVCTVADRGPYGVKGRPWQAIIDLSPALSEAIHLDGHDHVRIIYRVPTPRVATRPPRHQGVAPWTEEARKRARDAAQRSGPDS
jgi:rare lipoprotein A (peptidoglycan hydrolase)